MNENFNKYVITVVVLVISLMFIVAPVVNGAVENLKTIEDRYEFRDMVTQEILTNDDIVYLSSADIIGVYTNNTVNFSGNTITFNKGLYGEMIFQIKNNGKSDILIYAAYFNAYMGIANITIYYNYSTNIYTTIYNEEGYITDLLQSNNITITRNIKNGQTDFIVLDDVNHPNNSEFDTIYSYYRNPDGTGFRSSIVYLGADRDFLLDNLLQIYGWFDSSVYFLKYIGNSLEIPPISNSERYFTGYSIINTGSNTNDMLLNLRFKFDTNQTSGASSGLWNVTVNQFDPTIYRFNSQIPRDMIYNTSVVGDRLYFDEFQVEILKTEGLILLIIPILVLLGIIAYMYNEYRKGEIFE